MQFLFIGSSSSKLLFKTGNEGVSVVEGFLITNNLFFCLALLLGQVVDRLHVDSYVEVERSQVNISVVIGIVSQL